MGKRKSDDGWGAFVMLLLAAVGAIALYYTQVGRGEESDAALIPNSLEGRIDLVVAALNKQFGKRWIDWSMDALKSYLQRTLPATLVTLVDVVSTVELMSRNTRMTSDAKQRIAAQMLLAG